MDKFGQTIVMQLGKQSIIWARHRKQLGSRGKEGAVRFCSKMLYLYLCIRSRDASKPSRTCERHLCIYMGTNTASVQTVSSVAQEGMLPLSTVRLNIN